MMDPNETNNATISDATTNANLSIEQIYENEREQAKIRNWKESPYAVGLVEATWADELARYKSRSSSHQNRGPCGDCCNDDDEMDPTCGCIKLSAIVCTKLGAKRVGNMAILNYSVETVEEDDDEEDENGNLSQDITDEESQGLALTESSSTLTSKKKRMVFRRKMDIVVGPYWPMLVFITYPLIIGVSLWTAVNALPGMPTLFIVFWLCCTVGLCLSLFATGCRDPGIMLRKHEPPSNDATRWRWNDQARTWRPYGAIYDPDCACVVEKFDHTCPWTGTAIGKKNMPAFQLFLFFVFFNLVMDLYLLTSAI